MDRRQIATVRPNAMRNELRPNLYVCVVFIVIACACVGYATYSAWTNFSQMYPPIYSIVMICGALGLGWCIPWVVEDMTVTLDERGIEQTKIFYKGQFWVRRRLPW